MTRTALDFSAAFPSATAVRAAGHEAVIGYFSDSRPGANFGAKPMTRAAADAYRAGGVDLVTNYQYGKGDTSDWRGGFPAGVDHGKRCLDRHFAAGGPPFRPLYAPCDSSPSLAEYNTMVAPFLRGWASVVGLAWTGLYGNSLVHAWAQQDGLATWFWLHNWGGNQTPDAQTHMHQVQIDKGAVDGIGVDINEILRDDYGQWSKAAAPAPAPVPATQGVSMPPRRAMWSPNCDDRPRNVTWLCFHTQEGNGTADSLARYLDNPASGVSYNTVGDARELIDVVPFDRSPWAALGANGRADHFCFGGSFSAWSRQQWLDCGMLDNAAAWLADRAPVRGIPIAYVGTDGVRNNQPGVIGHVDWTRGAGEGTHTDPGPNFPWDELIARAQRFTNPPTPTATPGVEVTPDECRQAMRDVLNEQAPTRVPGSTVALGLADCIRNADAASFIALHTVTDPITSGVLGSTVEMPPRDVWRNADAAGFEEVAQMLPQIVARLDAIDARLNAPAGSTAASTPTVGA